MFASADLHILIASMSQSERRLFRLRAQSSGKRSANYLRLFEVIAAQEVYDEEAVKACFAGERLVNNFSVAKAYLYQSILDSLRQGRVRKSPEMEVRELIDQIEILYDRGLGAQARKTLDKALKKADKYQLAMPLAELYRWQRQLTNLRGGKDRVQLLQEVESLEGDALGTADREATLQSLRARIQSIYLNHIDLRDPATAKMVTELMAHPLLVSPPDTGSFFSQLYYHQCYAVFHRMEGHSDLSLEAYRKVLRVWERSPLHQKAYPDKYLLSLTAFLDNCLREAEYSEFTEQVGKIHAMDPVEPRLKARAFYLGNHLELRYAITTYQFTIGLRRVRAIENGLKKHRFYLSPSIELTFLYNLAILFFLAQDYRSAINFLNKVGGQRKSPVRQDIVDTGRLFELVCHYELGHFDVLESRLRSIQRFLKGNPRQHPYEQLLLKGIRNLLDAPPHKNKAVFQELKDQFDAMEGATYLIGREEFMLWIRSHIEGIPPSAMDPPTKKRN